jgi:hypothetical protein
VAEYKLHKRHRPKNGDLRWKRRRVRVEPVAGQDGRPVSGNFIRWNGRPQFVPERPDIRDPPAEPASEPSKLPELRRRLAKVRAQYRLSGEFDDLELTIMDLAFDGMSLDDIGERVGMTRQGVWYHVQDLLLRALYFATSGATRIE